MGRKKKKPTKPWCWYCNREFDDEKILIQHQKAKHFKCHVCHKKLYTGPGLAIHCMQVHKEMIDKIPNALPNKNSVDIEIYGMQGIPEEDIREHDKNRGNDSYIPPPSTIKPLIQTPLIPGGLLPSTITGPATSSILPPLGFPGMPRLPPLPGGPPPSNFGSIMPPHAPPPISINLPRKPLFPSASAMLGATAIPPSNSATIAAGPSTSGSILSAPAILSKPSATISTGNPMSKIIHPAEDISLEELRLRSPKYQRFQSQPLLPTGPPPSFHIPPPGFNGNQLSHPPPQIPPPIGRRWDAPPPSQASFQSTFKPAF